eukprot:5311553-Prymnesium_polylepis.1
MARQNHAYGFINIRSDHASAKLRAYATVRDVRVLGCGCCGKRRSTKLNVSLPTYLYVEQRYPYGVSTRSPGRERRGPALGGP